MTIQFANPVFFAACVTLALLLMWRFSARWQRRTALRFPVGRFLSSGLPAGRGACGPLGAALLLRTLAFVLLAVALAGPRTPDLHTRIEAEGVAVVMLVDVSGSMATRDFDWHGDSLSRLDAVSCVFRLFITGDADLFRGRPTDAIGLVVFATRPLTVCPLTLSHSVLLRLLDDEKPRSVPGESETNISDAVALGSLRETT